MKGLDFSGWKKVGEDKKTTTLKHEKGHMITLAHSKLPRIQQEALKRIKFAEGTPDGTAGDKKDPSPVTVNVGTPQAAPIQSSTPVAPNVPKIPQAPIVANPDQTMNPSGTMASGLAGARLGTQNQAAQAAGEVGPLQENIANQQALNKVQTDNQNLVNNAFNDLKNYTNDPKNKFNENQYLENMGAGRKISTALGLILGGAGSGVAGGSNPALDFLNSQIDRNIQGQKERYGRQQNVWGAAKDLFGDNNVADSFARAHNLEMLKSKAELISKQLGTPQAAAAYMDLQSKLAPAISKSLQDSAVQLSNLPGYTRANGKEAAPVENLPPGANAKNPNQKLIDANIVSGTPSAQASVPSEKPLIEPDSYADTSILKPGAQDHLDQLRYVPKARDEIDQIKSQYSQAQMADTLLSQLHDVHQTLYKDALKGGSAGYIRRHDPTSAIPFVGEGLSRTFVQPATANETNKDYDLNRTRIVGDIAAALRGTNISGEEINHIVSANSPEPGDSPELVAKKERAIRLFIKNNVNKSLLKDWGLSTK